MIPSSETPRRPPMRRPKLADMNLLELARWRILQFRRAARRTLNRTKWLEREVSEDRFTDVKNLQRAAQCIIAVTKPRAVARCSVEEAAVILGYIHYVAGPGDRSSSIF